MRTLLPAVTVCSALLMLTSCGVSKSPYETFVASPQGVVIENYFPADMDMMFSLDTRRTEVNDKLVSYIKTVVPQLPFSTFDEGNEQFWSAIESELSKTNLDIRSMISLHNRVVVGIDFPSYEETKAATEKATEEMNLPSEDTYGISQPNMLASAEMPDPEAVIAVELENVYDLAELLENIPADTFTEYSYKGATYVQLHDDAHPMFSRIIGDVMVLATTEELMKELIDREQGRGSLLVSTADFKKMTADVSEEDMMWSYVNYKGFMDPFLYAMEYRDPESVEFMKGMMVVNSFMGTFSPEEDVLHVGSMVTLDKENLSQFGFSYKDLLHTDSEPSMKLPAGEVLYYQGGEHVASTQAKIMSSMDFKEAAFGMTLMRNMFQNNTGISIADELIPFFDQPLAIAVIDQGTVVPGFVTVIDVSADIDAAEDIMNKLEVAIDKGIISAGTMNPELAPILEKVILKSSENNVVSYMIDIPAILEATDASGVMNEEVVAAITATEIGLTFGMNDGHWYITTMSMDSVQSAKTSDDAFIAFIDAHKGEERISTMYMGIHPLASYAERIVRLTDKISPIDRSVRPIIDRVLYSIRQVQSIQGLSTYESEDETAATIEIPLVQE